MTPILPKKKQALLSYLKEYITTHNFAPTLTEIAQHFKVSSLATIHEHLQFLEERGFIKRDKSTARGLSIAEIENDRPLSDGIALPVVGMIAAGQPIEAIENRDQTITVPTEVVGQHESYVLKVKGDSMIESSICDGDYVIIEKTETARNGEMVVALLDDGSATLKKFYREKNAFRLQPANKKYKPLIVPNVTIQGRVKGVIRRFA